MRLNRLVVLLSRVGQQRLLRLLLLWLVTFLRGRLLRLLLLLFGPDLLEEIWIPLLPDVRMGLDAVHERRLAQMIPTALDEGKLDVVPAAVLAVEDVFAEFAHVRGHVHGFELRIVGDALEEGDGEARAAARFGGQDAVRRAHGHAARHGFQALADGDDECALDWWTWMWLSVAARHTRNGRVMANFTNDRVTTYNRSILPGCFGLASLCGLLLVASTS